MADSPAQTTDPVVRPQFGNRCLTEGSDVFAQNAWDNVEWDDEMTQQAQESVDKNSTVKLDDKQREWVVDRWRFGYISSVHPSSSRNPLLVQGRHLLGLFLQRTRQQVLQGSRDNKSLFLRCTYPRIVFP